MRCDDDGVMVGRSVSESRNIRGIEFMVRREDGRLFAHMVGGCIIAPCAA